MTALDKISKERMKPDDFVALIEISKGSKMKYELDKETGYIILDRVLYTATRYPANYGLIPRTLAPDGDHLDVLVLCSEAIETNCLVRCYPIGMITMIDQNFLDEKIIAVPFGDPTFNVYKSIHDLPYHISEEMMHFFTVYKTLEGKKTAVNKICDVGEAKQKIEDYLDFYEKTHRNDSDFI
jgi:inorganic pyrophosphatase